MILSVPGRRLLKNRDVQVGRWGFAAIGPGYGVIAGVTMGAGLMLAPFFLGAGLVGSLIVAMTGAIGITLNLTNVVVFGASPLLNFPLICVGLILGLCAIPAAYAGRWVAKNVVAAGLAERCQIALAYSIGVPNPVWIDVNTFGTETESIDSIKSKINENFDLRPRGIIEDMDLLRPIYTETSAYGHFGRENPDFNWEKTDNI